MSSLLSAFGGGGQPQSIQVRPPGQSEGSDKPAQILKQMIALAHKYIDVEPDQIDKHTMTKVLVQLQSYLAEEQSNQEKATGTTPQAKYLAKASQ